MIWIYEVCSVYEPVWIMNYGIFEIWSYELWVNCELWVMSHESVMNQLHILIYFANSADFVLGYSRSRHPQTPEAAVALDLALAFGWRGRAVRSEAAFGRIIPWTNAAMSSKSSWSSSKSSSEPPSSISDCPSALLQHPKETQCKGPQMRNLSNPIRQSEQYFTLYAYSSLPISGVCVGFSLANSAAMDPVDLKDNICMSEL